MRTIVEMIFGSTLYGTNTPASDTDIKAVHVPAGGDILLGRVKPVISRQTKAATGARNTSEDTDFESYSLQKYLALVAEGQTVALDMLFAPDWALRRVRPEWREIQANRSRLLTRRYASFVGYCRQQANKYGIKGSRVAAARRFEEALSATILAKGTTPNLGAFADDLAYLVGMTEHTALVDIPTSSGIAVRHLEVCGRKMPFTASIKNAHDVVARLVAEYGQRALQAESNEGVDWKALSHAVRIGRQAIEVLETGNVEFPRPDRTHLLAIKKGEMPYQSVAEEIESLLAEIEAAAERSTLPDAPDYAWIDDFVAEVYRRAVNGK